MKRLLAFGFGLLLLLLVEGFLHVLPAPDGSRLAAPEDTEAGFQPIMLRGNPYLLWELLPGERTMGEGQRVVVNSQGFRGPERGEKTRPRALALGDSSVYGAGVDQDQVFTAELEKQLPADFVNGAVPGYSTTQALNVLHTKALAYDPDLLIVATLWSDNNFDRFVDREVMATYAAWERSSAGTVYRALSWSRIYGWLSLTLDFAAHGVSARTVGWIRLDDPEAGKRRRVPIDDYAANLAGFCSTMAERGGGVVFVVLPNREDLKPTVDDPPWDPYRQVMRDTAAACKAPLVELPEAFQRSGGGLGSLFIDEMHPTAEGHRLMARTIADALKRVGWPQSPLLVTDPGGPVPTPEDPLDGVGIPVQDWQHDAQQPSRAAPPPPPPGR